MNYLMPSHYDDIVEERSIILNCGYPLCSKILVNIPKQQFKISSRTNEVFDITERKKFCSNICFKSSTYLREQISSTPLWLRKNDEKIVVQFLQETNNGTTSKKGMGDLVSIKSSIDCEIVTEKVKEEAKSSGVPKKKSPDRRAKTKQQNNSVFTDSNFSEINNVIREWWTPRSRHLIIGEIYEDEKQNEANEKSDNIKLSDTDMKVNAFIKGEIVYSLDKLTIKEKQPANNEIYLPIVDKNAQVSLRKKILLDNLKRG